MSLPRIDTYVFGRIEIDGCTYTSDVIILPTGVRDNWWRDEGHKLKPGDLKQVSRRHQAFWSWGRARWDA